MNRQILPQRRLGMRFSGWMRGLSRLFGFAALTVVLLAADLYVASLGAEIRGAERAWEHGTRTSTFVTVEETYYIPLFDSEYHASYSFQDEYGTTHDGEIDFSTIFGLSSRFSGWIQASDAPGRGECLSSRA